MVKNKRGWIKILEAFLAIVLLMGLLFVIISNSNVRVKEGDAINKAQVAFLHNLAVNDTLRNDILSLDSLPINSNESAFPEELENYFLDNFENCFMSICPPDSECVLNFSSSGEIYSEEILINADRDIYSPRKVKILCYENEI